MTDYLKTLLRKLFISYFRSKREGDKLSCLIPRLQKPSHPSKSPRLVDPLAKQGGSDVLILAEIQSVEDLCVLQGFGVHHCSMQYWQDPEGVL